MGKLYIGISGKMGSGKSTLTKGIIRETSTPCEVVSLAKPIKDTQNLIYEHLNMKMVGEKDRDLLIALGMWGRGKCSNFWLDKAVESMFTSEAQVIICDDVRFENEAEWFKKNGILMRITGEQRGPNVDHNVNNKTETALDNFPFDYYVDNRGGIQRTLENALYCIQDYSTKRNKEDADGRKQERLPS